MVVRRALLILLLPFVAAQGAPTCQEVFSKIYEGSTLGSSTPAATIKYRQFLQKFLKEKSISSVVDLGCGDWQFSQLIDWSGIHYIGVDVIPSLIDKNRKQFGSSTIQFLQMDATEKELPPADLLICKDILQFLPQADILKIIPQFSKYRYCLVTSDVHPTFKTSRNPDTERGKHRLLDITKAPYKVKAEPLFYYSAGPLLKQVLLISGS